MKFIDDLTVMARIRNKNWLEVDNAGINLTGYKPPPPGHPGAFAPKCVPSPRAFAQQKMPGAGPINDDAPGAGHLHQHKEC